MSGLVLLELESWLETPVAADFPYATVVRYVRSVGKHFVAATVVEMLVRARECRPAGDDCGRARLRRFLDVLLDKHDATFDYSTYAALDVLREPVAEGVSASQQDVRARIALLICDVVAFECGAALGRRTEMPHLRPSPAAIEKRIRHGVRIAGVMHPQGTSSLTPVVPGLEERLEQLARVRAAAPPELVRTLDHSLFPVYVIHDEYLFIRVLQSFESVFEFLAGMARETIVAFEGGNAEEAIRLLAEMAAMLNRGLPLFSMLATMQRESFEFFRKFTEGASAIQSVSYKDFEIRCGTPDEERLHSAAFVSVPGVRSRALQSLPTVRGAADACLARGACDVELEARTRAAMAQVEAIHQRWKQTHYRLAVRMIGSVGGTGYTAGTPYLRSVIDNRLFRTPQEAAR